MSWPIPEIPDFVKAPTRSRWKRLSFWLLLLLLFYLLWLPLLGGLWYKAAVETSWLQLLSWLPLPLWALAVFAAFSNAFHQEAAFQAWEQEKQHLHQRWIAWAQQHIAVIDAALLLPPELQQHPKDVRFGQKATFADKTFPAYRHPDIMSFFQSKLEALLQQIKLKELTIHVVEPDMHVYQEWIWQFEAMLENLGVADKIKMDFSNGYYGLDKVADWINDGMEGLHIAISTALNDDPHTAEFTENAVWTVFAPSVSWAQSQHLSPTAFIRRPIDIPLSDKAAAQAALQQFDTYALADTKVSALWPAGLTPENANSLNAELGDSGILLKHKEIALQRPDQYIGQPPLNAAWLVLAMALQAESQASFLLAWEKETDICSMALVQNI